MFWTTPSPARRRRTRRTPALLEAPGRDEVPGAVAVAVQRDDERHGLRRDCGRDDEHDARHRPATVHVSVFPGVRSPTPGGGAGEPWSRRCARRAVRSGSAAILVPHGAFGIALIVGSVRRGSSLATTQRLIRDRRRCAGSDGRSSKHRDEEREGLHVRTALQESSRADRGISSGCAKRPGTGGKFQPIPGALTFQMERASTTLQAWQAPQKRQSPVRRSHSLRFCNVTPLARTQAHVLRARREAETVRRRADQRACSCAAGVCGGTE